MTDLLEMPEIRQRAFAVSVEAYHRLTDGQPTELLRGTIIQKMSKSPLHSYLGRKLARILSARIVPPYLLSQEQPLTLSDSEPEPDFAVVEGSEDEFATTHPSTAALVIEIAVTSLAIDRVKALIYAEAGVLEYWIIDPARQQMIVNRHPSQKGYLESMTFDNSQVVASSSVPNLEIDLRELFAKAPRQNPLA